MLKNNTYKMPEKIQSFIVSQNSLIDHNNQLILLVIVIEFQSTTSFSSSQFTTFNYKFQYIKYESDDGFFIKK